MPILEQEWESIYSAIRSGASVDEFIEGIVSARDENSKSVNVAELGSEPIFMAALDYESTLYRGDEQTKLRSVPRLPEIGERVLIARPGGSRHQPRLIGVVNNGDSWKQPEDVHLGGDMVFGSLEVHGQIEVFRSNEFQAAYKAAVDEDTLPRLQIRADGFMAWSDGSAVFDTNLYRASGGTLKTDDAFEAANIASVGTGYIGGQLSVGIDAASSTGIEIGNSLAASPTTPYIDFHLGAMGAQDYNVRVINGADKQLSLHAPGGGVQFVVNGGVETTDLYADGAIQFGAGTGGFEFSGIKHVSASFNPPNLTAHSGAVTTFSFPLGTCATGDLVMMLGPADPGSRAIRFTCAPTAHLPNQVEVWFFNADTVALDLISQTFHFIIFNL